MEKHAGGRPSAILVSVTDITTGNIVLKNVTRHEAAVFIGIAYNNLVRGILDKGLMQRKYRAEVTGIKEKIEVIPPSKFGSEPVVKKDKNITAPWKTAFKIGWNDVYDSAELIRHGEGKIINVISHGKRKKFTERTIL